MPELQGGEVNGAIESGGGDLRAKVTALLADIARTPESEINTAWETGFRPGAVVGRFELLRELGRGGFGVVFEARDRELGRLVAFKAVRPGTRARSAQRMEWLAREAEAAAQLNHENIVALHDVGRSDGGPYIIFELLDGETLSERLRRGPLEIDAAVRIALSVGRALAWAHASGVIHRDLKPSNVFLTSRGTVKVLDFGLARVFGRAGSESGGTPAYMAPEQWRGETEDARTDVFAFGVLLYEMFTGRIPFEFQDGRSTVVTGGPAPSIEGIPIGLRRCIRAALSSDPAQRPRTIEAVLESLELFAARRRNRWLSRRIAAAAAAVALLLVVAGGVAAWRSQRGAGEHRAVSVAVADVSNDTGDPDLDGIAGMLATSLEQSPRLEVVTRSRLVDASRQLGSRQLKMDEAAAREAARSVGVKALLVAAVHRVGELYSVELQAVEPASGRELFRLREQASSKDRLAAVVDRLTDRVRERLRDSGDERAQGATNGARVASSLDAYAHYFKAQQLRELGDLPSTLQELGAAIEADPGFALAYWLRSYLGEFTGEQIESRREDAQRALSLADRLPRKERLLVEAWAAHSAGDDAKATALYAQAVEAFPYDKDVLYLAGDLLHHAGRTSAALDLFLRALKVDPSWPPAAYHAIDDLARLDRNDQLLEVARRAVEVAPVPASYEILSYAYRYRGDADDAVAASRRAVEVGGGMPEIQQLSDTLIWAERLDEAEVWARRMMQPSVAPAWRLEGFHQRVKVLGMRGKYREAVRVLDAIPPAAQAANLTHHHEFITDVLALVRDDPARLWLAAQGRHSAWVAAELAYAGDLDNAAKVARRLEDDSWRNLYEGVVAWRRGEKDEAVAKLTRVTQRRTAAELLANLYLGELLGEMGRDTEALEALARFQASPEMNAVRVFGYPRSLLYTARSQERIGMRGQALANVNELLALWKAADSDLPELSEARSIGARLVVMGPRR